MPAIFSIIGMTLNLIGVIVLFRYGMPYRVRTGGNIGRIIQQKDEGARVLDVEYHNFGLLGLGAVVIGTVFQIDRGDRAVLVSPGHAQVRLGSTRRDMEPRQIDPPAHELGASRQETAVPNPTKKN